jgi:alanine racemase
VDDLDELRALRQISDKRALVLGYVPAADLAEAVRLGGELAIYDLERLPAFAEAGGGKVHVKIDALLGRQGVLPGSVGRIVQELVRYPEIEVASAYAHFANIEDTTDLGHAQEQIAVFDVCFGQLRATFPNIARHLSATSGLMTVEQESTTPLDCGDLAPLSFSEPASVHADTGSDSRNNLVRLGIGLYGMYPSAALARRHAALQLQPAMRWRTGLAQVKVLPARHPIGYGLTYVTPREMRIGIVPQGYSDGYDRGLSNVGEVLVGGRRRPVLGRVAMNMFAIDLSEPPEAFPEDEVVLLGSQGDERITAEELASRLGTINYEVVARVSPLLRRRVVNESVFLKNEKGLSP